MKLLIIIIGFQKSPFWAIAFFRRFCRFNSVFTSLEFATVVFFLIPKSSTLRLTPSLTYWMLNCCWSSPAWWLLAPSPTGNPIPYFTLWRLWAFRIQPRTRAPCIHVPQWQSVPVIPLVRLSWLRWTYSTRELWSSLCNFRHSVTLGPIRDYSKVWISIYSEKGVICY
jgi:hypothetical protein